MNAIALHELFFNYTRRVLTKVAVNELGDFPHSESDEEEDNTSQRFYMNPLVSDDPWTTHVGVNKATVPKDADDDFAYVEHNLADSEVEYHHGLYWRRDGILKEPLHNMQKTCGRLNPEYVKNFGTPLASIMSICPLIYWNIISCESNDNALIKLDQQFTKIGKHTISRSRFQKILQLYGILMMMVLFPLPGATYTAYWSYGSPKFP
jgi:hypothetical protein